VARLRPILRVLFPVLTIIQLAFIVEQSLDQTTLTDFDQPPLQPLFEESNNDQNSDSLYKIPADTFDYSDRTTPNYINATTNDYENTLSHQRGSLVLLTGPPRS
jgi:hypothetical protein